MFMNIIIMGCADDRWWEFDGNICWECERSEMNRKTLKNDEF